MTLEDVAAGALGGALVGLMTAASIAELGERGRHRAVARNQMQVTLGIIQQSVLVASMARGSGGPDELAATRPDTHRVWADQLAAKLPALSRLRRWRAERATLALFGPTTLGLATNLPGRGRGAQDAMFMSRWMLRETAAGKLDLGRRGALERAAAQPTEESTWVDVDHALRRLRKAVN